MVKVSSIKQLIPAPKDGEPVMCYMAGEYQSAVEYIRTNESTPIVEHNDALWYPANVGTIVGTEPTASSTAWKLLTRENIIYAKIVMSAFGKIGSAVFYGDYMFSQYGRIYNANTGKYTYSYNYQLFDVAKYEAGKQDTWRPVMALNLRDGSLNAGKGTFENLTIRDCIAWNLRSPFVPARDPNTVDVILGDEPIVVESQESDNLLVRANGGGWLTDGTLDWSTKSIGRRITITGVDGIESNVYRGYVTFRAPAGKWFYINGDRRSSLVIRNTLVELIGYGYNNTFYGWIVTNVRDVMSTPDQCYGKPLNCLAMGSVTGNSNGASFNKLSMFNGGTIGGQSVSMTVTRRGTGWYRVTIPSAWNLGTEYFVSLTAVGRSEGRSEQDGGWYGLKPTLVRKESGYFDVALADDESSNDGSFDFMLFNLNDV